MTCTSRIRRVRNETAMESDRPSVEVLGGGLALRKGVGGPVSLGSFRAGGLGLRGEINEFEAVETATRLPFRRIGARRGIEIGTLEGRRARRGVVLPVEA